MPGQRQAGRKPGATSRSRVPSGASTEIPHAAGDTRQSLAGIAWRRVESAPVVFHGHYQLMVIQFQANISLSGARMTSYIVHGLFENQVERTARVERHGNVSRK